MNLKKAWLFAISIGKCIMVSGIHDDIQLINEIRWEVGLTSRKMRTTHTIAKNVESLMMMLKNFSTLCSTHLFLELTLTSIEISQHSAAASKLLSFFSIKLRALPISSFLAQCSQFQISVWQLSIFSYILLEPSLSIFSPYSKQEARNCHEWIISDGSKSRCYWPNSTVFNIKKPLLALF